MTSTANPELQSRALKQKELMRLEQKGTVLGRLAQVFRARTHQLATERRKKLFEHMTKQENP
jgi:hypothetical protein